MAIDSLSINSSSYTTTGSQSQQNATNNLGKDAFLKILSAQLQYQDPMESVDDSAYIAQLAQFSTLEQMDNLNTNMLTLINLQNVQLGTSLIGKEVKVTYEGQSQTGIIEKVKNLNGELTFTCNGQEYSIDNINEIINE
ncbi:flagellar hook capping FlgD N-terminal domain-containing protein [Clostridium grantii]|uniref:Flagellar basal-body rod modification protein FlgD n=1 Tax=Clostridium grantii DSM 8605 TaxID=1121316 RepID=A0A1M5XK22_9CLOT|nr:flagellar hook capping FlgD N-terminal domain-containing protein [Clostridium grantii]SHH99864.1 flagellar basal-body rod modification protein FlgD [Clostridium grantii DSM 8605]